MSEMINGPELTAKLEGLTRVAGDVAELFGHSFRHRLTEAVARRMIADGVSRSMAETRSGELSAALGTIYVAAQEMIEAGKAATETLSSCRTMAARARANDLDDFVL